MSIEIVNISWKTDAFLPVYKRISHKHKYYFENGLHLLFRMTPYSFNLQLLDFYISIPDGMPMILKYYFAFFIGSEFWPGCKFCVGN